MILNDFKVILAQILAVPIEIFLTRKLSRKRTSHIECKLWE